MTIRCSSNIASERGATMVEYALSLAIFGIGVIIAGRALQVVVTENVVRARATHENFYICDPDCSGTFACPSGSKLGNCNVP